MSRVPTPVVPDFTPIASRRSFFASESRPPLPSAFVFGQTDPDRGKLPATLHAPRYSHLMEEALSIANASSANAFTSGASSGSASTSTDEGTSSDSISPPTSLVSEAPSTSVTAPQPSPGLRDRMKTYLISYLPILSKSKPGATVSKPQEERRPGLPLPPPEILEKQRGPVHTPISKPIPKLTHPKSLVNLQPSRIPRLQVRHKQMPKRLVELRPVSPPIEHTQPVFRASQARRSSGSSVKDLVRSFEEMESEKSMEMERPRSQTSLRGSYRASDNVGIVLPTWRP